MTEAEERPAASTRRFLEWPLVLVPGTVFLLLALGLGFLVYRQLQPTGPSSFEHADELLQEIRESGISLTNVQVDEIPGAQSTAYATADPGGDLYVVVFANPARVDNMVDHDFDALADRNPPAPERFLVGPNWVVNTYGDEGTERLNEVLHGRVFRR